MGWVKAGLLTLGLMACTTPAPAQELKLVTPQEDPDDTSVEKDCLPKAVAARSIEIGEIEGPFAVAMLSGALSYDCLIVSVYDATNYGERFRGEPKPVFYFRSQTGMLRTPPVIEYADSRTCPGAIESVRALEAFEPHSMRLDILHPSDRIVVTADGGYYRFWTNEAGSDDRKGFEMDVGGWNYPGLDKVWIDLVRPLRSCWSNRKPQ